MPTKSTFGKEIIYPIFLECCQYTENVFWENLFENLSYGKTPRGAYISKNFLCCSYKGREFNYKIERKKPEILYNDVYTLLNEKLGVLSQKQKQEKRKNFREIERNIRDNRLDWSNIKKDNVKQSLYQKYVIDMKQKHNLNKKQTKYLMSLIKISTLLQKVVKSDIKYEGNRIIQIDGIEFEDNKVKLTRDFSFESNIENNLEKLKYNPQPKRMKTEWDKYIKTLLKRKL